MGDVVLRATGLIKRYDEAVTPALAGVDLTIDRGVLTSIMGPSGSGKSTLLHMFGGLDRPTAGDVELEGRSLNALDDNALTLLRRSTIGVIFQAFNLVPVLSAADNVALPAVIAGDKPGSYAARLAYCLELVGLTEHAAKLPSQLSGGQQQRVAVARALFIEPSLILADEPTGNLDTTSGAEVLGLLRRAVDDLGATVVMVTHDPRAAAIGDAVVLLRDGAVAGHLSLATDDDVDERARQILRWLVAPDATPPARTRRRTGAATPTAGPARTARAATPR